MTEEEGKNLRFYLGEKYAACYFNEENSPDFVKGQYQVRNIVMNILRKLEIEGLNLHHPLTGAVIHTFDDENDLKKHVFLAVARSMEEWLPE